MTLGDDGQRRALYHERKEKLLRVERGDPLVVDRFGKQVRGKIAAYVARSISPEASESIVLRLRVAVGKPDGLVPMVKAVERILGTNGTRFEGELREFLMSAPVNCFLSALEAIADRILSEGETSTRIAELQAILADELVGYRFRAVDGEHRYNIVRIDNPHLYTCIVDRTFELTRRHAFRGAQRDYSEGRAHYAKGDFADAIVKAGKAYESAMKAVLDKLEVGYTNESAAKLAKLLFDNGIIGSRLETFHRQLLALFQNGPNTVRNMPGAAHGSAGLDSYDAALAGLVLNLTGSLIVFLVEAYERGANTR